MAARQLAAHSVAAPLAGYLVAFACVIACVIAVAYSAPKSGRICLFGSLGAGILIASAHGDGVDLTWSALCVLLALLTLGTAIGTQIGLRVKQSGHLLFVAIVSGLADTWSVTQPGGISQRIAEEPAALSLLALPWPMLGTTEIPALLGVGDVVFVALYIAASRALALPVRRTLLALVAGFVLTTLCVVYFERPIPVLPWLGICFVMAQPAARSVASDDLRRGAWVLTALAGALAVWFLRRSL